MDVRRIGEPLSTLMALLFAISLLCPRQAIAQFGLDRGLTRGADTDREKRDSGIHGLIADGTDSVLKAKWILQPMASAATKANDVGLLIGYRNTSRFTTTPWQLDVRGLRRYRAGTTKLRWQVGGEIDPPLPSIGKLPLLGIMTALYAQTADVERTSEIAGEIDIPILQDSTLLLGGIAYYDWRWPESASAQHGATFGVTSFFEKGPLRITPEYDFSSSFNGGDYYSIAASLLLFETPAKSQVRLRGGWGKGDTFSLRIQLGVPSNRRLGGGPLRNSM
jgi:hypothetical protein